jgi:hypothetical protein
MTYKEKLKHPRWQRKRLEVLNRDNFKCRFCGDTETELQIHHAFYLNKDNPEDYSGNMLFTLCKKCHQDEENLKSEDGMIYAQMLQIGISRRHLIHLTTELRRYFKDGYDKNKFFNLMDFLYEE